MTTFTCIDGEGLTRDDGSHDYTLLAASDGRYIESYALGGLGTEEAFEFLLDTGEQNKGDIICGFFLSYDFNMMFRDLPAHILEGLWASEMRSWRAGSGRYRHYRIECIPNRVLKIQRGTYRMSADGDMSWKTEKAVTVWDCFQFFQMSFVKALRDWDAADTATIDRIAEMKDKRGTFEDGMADEVRAYCFEEVTLLRGLMERVAATLDGLDLNLTTWYGAGSIASAMFRKHGVKRHISRDFETEVTTAIMSSYFGGRIETFGVGVIKNSSWNYDVRSAYPAAARDLPSLRDASWGHTKRWEEGEPWALWRIRWQARDSIQRLAPFPFRHKKRIFWPTNGEGWYHTPEVSAALSEPVMRERYDFEIIEGWILRPANDDRPFSFIQDIYDERARLKREHDPREKPLKLAMNAAYGKCAQSAGGRDGKPPPYQCYYWAGAMTSNCRAKLLRAACAAGDGLLAIATDGIFSRTEIPSLYMGQSLGDWESTEVEPGLMLIQPGVYASPHLGACSICGSITYCACINALGSFGKTRGFGSKGLQYEAFKTAWERDGLGAEIVIPETRFISFGYALATNSIETKWRRWISGDKHVHFSGTSSKSVARSARTRGADFVDLICPAAPAEMSDIYIPRTRTRAERVATELQNESLASQPDLEENTFTWK